MAAAVAVSVAAVSGVAAVGTAKEDPNMTFKAPPPDQAPNWGSEK